MKVFTLRRSEVGKLPHDFCSFGHLLSGYIINFVAFYIIGFLGLDSYFLGLSFVGSLWVSVLWEIIEEFNPKRAFGKDVLVNSLTDIILGMIGSTLSHWWSFYEGNGYLEISITFILITLVLYQICWKLTR